MKQTEESKDLADQIESEEDQPEFFPDVAPHLCRGLLRPNWPSGLRYSTPRLGRDTLVCEKTLQFSTDVEKRGRAAQVPFQFSFRKLVRERPALLPQPILLLKTLGMGKP